MFISVPSTKESSWGVIEKLPMCWGPVVATTKLDGIVTSEGELEDKLIVLPETFTALVISTSTFMAEPPSEVI